MSLPEVSIEAFEGPFDLLLELVGRQQVDLSDISLAELTDDYLAHVKEYEVAVSVQGEWLVIAATLLLLKARAAAAVEEQPEEEDEVYLRNRVRLYQLYRVQAERIREEFGGRVLLNAGLRVGERVPVAVFDGVMLRDGFARVLKRLPKPVQKRAHLVQYGKSLEECTEGIRSVLRKRKSFVFQQELKEKSRQELAVSFLAVLELQRSGQAGLEQERAWSDLVVKTV